MATRVGSLVIEQIGEMLGKGGVFILCKTQISFKMKSVTGVPS